MKDKSELLVIKKEGGGMKRGQKQKAKTPRTFRDEEEHNNNTEI